MMNIWRNYSFRASGMGMLTLILVLLVPVTVSVRLPPGARKYQNFVTIFFPVENRWFSVFKQTKEMLLSCFKTLLYFLLTK